jgi:Tol biopolymer transport system component
MPQPNVVCPFKKIHIVCTAELLFFILGSAEITLAQASVTPTETGIKKLVYQVQMFKGGGDLIYGLPGGSRPETSDIYEQVGQNPDVKQLVQGGQDPAWSARGDKIAFLGFTKISTEQHQDTPEGTLQSTSVHTEQWHIEGTSLLARQIYAMNPDGSGRRQITNVTNGIWDFAWSPSENRIAYCEQGKDGKTAIVVINSDGSGRQELTKMGEIRCAVGMPILQRTLDKSMTMTASKSGGGRVLVKLVGPTESTAVDEVVTGEIVGVPTLAWSPDGRFIAFTGIMNGKPVIGVVDKDGKARPLGIGYSVYWSSDGKRLLFRHDSNSNPPVTALCLVNADGTEPRKILDNESAEFGVAWFPDGRSIVFGSRRDTENQSEMFRINTDGGGLQKIASRPNTSLSNPVVSPDGTKLIVDAHTHGADVDTHDPSLLLVDLVTHQQEFLGKGSHASILW